MRMLSWISAERRRLLLSLAGLLALTLGGLAARHLPARPSGAPLTQRWLRPGDLPELDAQQMEIEGDRLAVGERTGHLAFAVTPLAGVTQIELAFRATAPFDFHGIIVYYAARRYWQHHLETTNDFIMRRGVRPVVNAQAGQVKLCWHLPGPAALVRFDFPPGTRMEWEYLELRGRGPTPEERTGKNHEAFELLPSVGGPDALRLAWWGTLLAVGWWLASLWCPILRVTYAGLRGLLVAIFAVMGGMLAVVLPPFQAPDENRHWQAALALHRANAAHEVELYYLPEYLGALPPRWLSHVPFAAARFHAVPGEAILAEGVSVGYGSRLTYPVVALVAWCWPRVASVEEALVFYYLCRLLAAAATTGLLWLGWRGGMVGFTLLLFMTTPLMVQQSAAVTSDTVVNLGSLATAFLFVAAWRQPTWLRLTALWSVALIVTAAKPPTALLLLPLALLPWRRLPYKPLLIPCLLLGLLALAWLGLELGVRLVIRSDPGRTEQVLAQYALLKQGPGVENFATALRALLPPAWDEWDAWYQFHQPLGWLDTNLGVLHRLLIYVSLGLGLVLDLLIGGKLLWQSMRERAGEVLALFGLGVVHALALIVGVSLLLFLANTPAGQSHFVGVQHRYFFPAVLVLLTLPTALKPSGRQANPSESALSSAGPTWAAGILLPLLAARFALLAIDVMTRYGP